MRAFNRYYTGIIGLLDQHILNSQYSLPEVRVLYELNYGGSITASDITISLGIDKGYLSRILRQFDKKKLISKKRSGDDGRATFLSLTKAGKNEFETLTEASNRLVRKILGALTETECDKLIKNMSAIKSILSKKP
jgi:DNA-binding MarR family transcriptional regulator